MNHEGVHRGLRGRSTASDPSPGRCRAPAHTWYTHGDLPALRYARSVEQRRARQYNWHRCRPHRPHRIPQAETTAADSRKPDGQRHGRPVRELPVSSCGSGVQRLLLGCTRRQGQASRVFCLAIHRERSRRSQEQLTEAGVADDTASNPSEIRGSAAPPGFTRHRLCRERLCMATRCASSARLTFGCLPSHESHGHLRCRHNRTRAQPDPVHLEALHVPRRRVRVMWTFALLCPTCFVAVFASFYNRKLLRELVLVRLLLPLGAHYTRARACLRPLHVGQPLLHRHPQLAGDSLDLDARRAHTSVPSLSGAAQQLRQADRRLRDRRDLPRVVV